MSWTRLPWHRWRRVARPRAAGYYCPPRCEVLARPIRGIGLPRPDHGVAVIVGRSGPGHPLPQFRRPGWFVDLEGYACGPGWRPDTHIERVFRTRARAAAFATYLAWCVDQLDDDQLREVGEMNQGRLL